MPSAVGAFSDAILAHLRADVGVKGLVGRHVYDQVPGAQRGSVANVSPPWIYLGPAGTKRSESDVYRGWEIRLRVYCVTNDFTRDSVWAIADAVDIALDNTLLNLGEACGFTLTDHLKMVDSGDVIDPTKPKAVFTDVVGIVFRNMPLFAGPTV